MGLSSSAAAPFTPEPAETGAPADAGYGGDAAGWLQAVQQHVVEALGALLVLPDERGLDPRWARAMERTRAFALRPAKRVRPALTLAGWTLAGGRTIPPGLWQFAAGLELVHTFMLVHDDVADAAELRRGGPALHRLLGPGRAGEDLAVVVGDHLYSRALEAMLGAGLPRGAAAVRYYLGVCRHTAAGQYLDLELGRLPLAQVRLRQALRVAHLKTARYGFSAPLVCGALLAGAAPGLLAGLERVGRHAGLAFQLQDDLLGLFGDPRVCGKPGDSDFAQGKRTFPVLAAWARAGALERAELEALWALPAAQKDAAALERARALVLQLGGRDATVRAVERATSSACRALAALPDGGGARALLDALFQRLCHRAA